MNTTVIKALAKINLAIDVLGKREDGYHEIDMVSVPLVLHDSIEITPLANTYETYLFCDDPTIVCDESNLAYKALDKMKERYRFNKKLRIFIYKKIPVQAGLGGGSADAAAVMKAVQHYIDPEHKEDKNIEEMAASIGADVPFCLYDRPSRVQGKGELLTPIKVKFPYHVLIVKPEIGLSTKSVYDEYDLIGGVEKRPNIEKLIEGLRTDDVSLIKENMINVLSVPAIRALPLIGEILSDMSEKGMELNGMSGTGSACFALFKDEKKAKKAASYFEKKGHETYLTQFYLR